MIASIGRSIAEADAEEIEVEEADDAKVNINLYYSQQQTLKCLHVLHEEVLKTPFKDELGLGKGYTHLGYPLYS